MLDAVHSLAHPQLGQPTVRAIYALQPPPKPLDVQDNNSEFSEAVLAKGGKLMIPAADGGLGYAYLGELRCVSPQTLKRLTTVR